MPTTPDPTLTPRYEAWQIAEKVIDLTIDRMNKELAGTFAGNLGLAARPDLIARMSATAALAEWLLGDNPILFALGKAQELLLEAETPHGQALADIAGLDDRFTYKTSTGEEVTLEPTADEDAGLHNVYGTPEPRADELEAERLLLGLSGRDAITIRNALRHLATTANDTLGVIPTAKLSERDAYIELDQAIDQAYAALGWARYPEKATS